MPTEFPFIRNYLDVEADPFCSSPRSGCCVQNLMDITNAKHNYDSLAACVNDLQKRGYGTDLEINERGLRSRVRETPLDPSKFTIDEFYRFEGTSDPADMSIVYAIASEGLGIKGIIVNAFGTYASSVVDKMVSRLDVHANIPEGATQPVNSENKK